MVKLFQIIHKHWRYHSKVEQLATLCEAPRLSPDSHKTGGGRKKSRKEGKKEEEEKRKEMGWEVGKHEG